MLFVVEQYSQRSVWFNLFEGVKEDGRKFGEEMRDLILEVLEPNGERSNII